MPEKTLNEAFGDIADAIRTKAGTAATMTPLEMPAAIAAIPSGGSGDLDELMQETF